MASPSIVIKVKFGETHRRLCAPISDMIHVFDIVMLREKIRNLFGFDSCVEFTLTYVDEDGDLITLGDDDDLLDVVKQCLNPLRITVNLINGTSVNPTPLKLLRSQPQSQTLNSGASQTLKAPLLPHQFQNLKSRVSQCEISSLHQPQFQAFNSGAASSLPGVAELVEKIKVAPLNKMSTSMAGVSVQPPTGGASNVDGEQCVKSKSSYIKNGKFLPNPAVGSIISNKEKEQPQKVTGGVRLKDMQPLRGVDLNIPYTEYESFQAQVNATEGIVEGSTGQNKNTTDDTKKKGVSGYVKAYQETNQMMKLRDQMNKIIHNQQYLMASQMAARSNKYTDDYGTGRIWHWGIRCDHCGVYPITGPRFKSKVKENYDLCGVCFVGNWGSVADYIRMDFPTTCSTQPMPYKGFYDHGPVSRSNLDGYLLFDVKTVAPLTKFTKIWRMCNNGTQAWPQGSKLQWIAGDKLRDSHSVDLEIPADGVGVGKILNISVDFTAPEFPGYYFSHWRMVSPFGQKFGQQVSVMIKVDPSMTDSGENLISHTPPPVVKDPEVVNHDHPMDSGNIFLNMSDSSGATVDLQPKKDTYVMPPTMVGTAPSPPTVPVPLVEPSWGWDSGSQEVSDEKEHGLVRDLEGMGFKQLDLNKDILRRNNYDLEKTIDDLCGVSEWDPMLGELQEMGFEDNEANRRLLKKNNGSIKHVVMDLINGDKA